MATTDTTSPPVTEPEPPITTTTTSSTTTTTDPTDTTTTTTEPPTTTTTTTTSTSDTTTSTSTTSTDTTSTSETSTTSTSTSTTTTTTPLTTPPPTQIIPPPTIPSQSTATVTVLPPPTETAGRDQSNADSGGFFNNKGAVAGVFSVVGLLGLVLLIALATNAIRRRRAKKFDEEVAAAAAEAANSPRYPYEYDDAPAGASYGGAGTGGGGGGGGAAAKAYSDPDSHGTYSQPAMSLGDSYNMSEYSRYGPVAAYGTGAAAMGAGAGAAMRQRNDPGYDPGIAGFGASTARTGSPPNPNAPTPYGAFAVPGGPAPGEMYDPTPVLQRRATNTNARHIVGVSGENPFEAAPVAVGGAYLNRGPSQHQQQQQQTSLNRQPSQPSSNYSSGYGHESYAAHYQPDFQANQHTYARNGLVPPESLPNPHSPGPAAKAQSQEGPVDDDEAYGADSYYPVRPTPQQVDSRMSLRDEDDYGKAPRTLKVANE